MEASAPPATRHHERHFSQDCGDRSRGNGRNWRFTLLPSVLSSAALLLAELLSAASGPAFPDSPQPGPAFPDSPLPGAAFSHSPPPGTAIHTPAPCLVLSSSVHLVSLRCFSENVVSLRFFFLFLCERQRILFPYSSPHCSRTSVSFLITLRNPHLPQSLLG